MGLENPRFESGAAVDLAQEMDFSLGSLTVIPSAREAIWGDSRETVEPRVMQVLVALARAEGAVVSRDELIQTCWDGRVVGEDSINRVIWRLRKLAESIDPAPFTIDTIPRIGYRLKADRISLPRPGHTLHPAESPRQKTQNFGWWAPAIVSLAALSLALAVWAFWPARQGGGPVLVPIMARDGEPAFAPDGTMLAYLAAPGVSPAGGRTAAHYSENAPSWSPDGKRLAYVVKKPGGECGIMVVVIRDGKARQAVPCKNAETSSLAWQAGTPFLYFTDIDASGNAIFRLDLRSGKTRKMTGAKQAGANWR